MASCLVVEGLGEDALNIQRTLKFLEEIVDIQDIDHVLAQCDQCDLCSHLNYLYGQQFLTNHASTDCLRCTSCHAWMKTPEKLAAHIGNCRGPGVCKFYASGYCRDQSRCPFPHPPHPQDRSEKCKSAISKKTRNIFEREECVFFRKGECKKGEQCPFKHGSCPCSLCAGPGHDPRHCVQCFKCQGWGHIAALCPNNK